MLSKESLSRKYTGEIASDYERERVGTKWAAENAAMADFLADIPEGSRILDVPVGTGRFLSEYKKRKFDAHGMDVSPDMLAETAEKSKDLGYKVDLRQGDIRAIPFASGFFALVVCIRFLNLVDWETVQQVIPELARASQGLVLFGIRYATPYRDLTAKFSDLVRLVTRSAGNFRYRPGGRRAVIHDRDKLTELLDRNGLKVERAQWVDRRWDGTDYVMYLCSKSGAKLAAPIQPD